MKAQRKKGERAYDAFLRQEFGESKRFIDSKFHVNVTTYAYPGGFFTDEMFDLAAEFRYTHLFTVQPGKVKRGMDDKTLPRYMILGNYDQIFEFATTFREATSPTQAASGGIAGLVQTTPYPVSPEAGAVVNSRTPEISADLSTVPDLDPATLSMKVGGFGVVPASFDPATHKFSWQVNRRLRQSICQVSITWKDTAGKAPESPLRWSFQLDREAAYMPDGE